MPLPTVRKCTTLCLLITVLMAATFYTPVWAAPEAPSQLFSWQAWTAKTPDNNFDLNRCQSLQPGDVNRDGHTDLICPYDYGSGSTATFVQISSGTAFSTWQAWSAKTPDNNFDLNRCKRIVVGTANPGRDTDLICPYDYGSGSTATFVMAGPASFDIYLPFMGKP